MTSQEMHYLETLSPEDKALIKCNVMEALALDFNKMKRWNEIMDTLAALCDGKRDELPKEIRLVLDEARPQKSPTPSQSHANGKGKHRKSGSNNGGDDDDKRRDKYVMKYSSSGTPLAEWIVVGGQSVFMQLENNKTDFKLLDKIDDLPDIILRPPERTSKLIIPYEFASKEEVKYYLDEARKLALDGLYDRIKAVYKKYVDASERVLILLTADTLFSYFQDRFPYTHYVMLVGDNGSGKNSIIIVFAHLGYRVFSVVGASAANFFRFYGDFEEGQGTITEDEVDTIDQDRDKQRILKAGYCSGGKVPKLNPSPSDGYKQAAYCVYSFKLLAAEKRPDGSKTKGFDDRTFYVQCMAGNPQYNIKDVIKSAGEEEYRQLHDELVHIRKLCLVYRLLHFDDAFKDVKLNIRNRERELTASIIRLFKGTKALEEVLPVLSDFLSEKREKKALSLEAKLYNVVKRLVLQHGHVLDNETIFEECKVALDLQPIQGSDHSLYSNVLEDVVSLKQISRVLLDKFGAKAEGKRKEQGI